MQLKHLFTPLSLLLLSAACSASDSATPASKPSEADAGLGPDVLVGTVEVKLVGPDADTHGYSSVFGKIYDKAPVETTVWEEAVSADGCSLLTPRVPFCETPCGSEACVEDDTCQPFPESQSAGTLTVKGLSREDGTSDAFEISPIKANYTTPGAISLAYPPFDEGDEVQIVASGAEVSGFTLKGKGIARLELTSEGDFPIATGKPLNLSWKPKSSASESRIQLKLDISHHGGSNGKIECDLADTGAFAIPVSLLDELLRLGVAGFPSILVTRSTLSSVLTSVGRVQLKIYENVERAVSVDGLVSCTEDDQCPDAQSCRPDLTCG